MLITHKKMTDEQVKADWCGLGIRHREQKAAAVRRYCIGRAIKETARLIDVSPKTIQEYLDWSGMADAGADIVNGGAGFPPPSSSSPTIQTAREVVKQYAPATPDNELVEEYETVGYLPDTAKRLAVAHQATEKALDAGKVKEEHRHKQSRIEEELFSPAILWAGHLNRIVGQIRSAARSLDQAKINDLNREVTYRRVMDAYEKLQVQIERLRNFHDTSDAAT